MQIDNAWEEESKRHCLEITECKENLKVEDKDNECDLRSKSRTFVNSDDIEKATKRIKKSTGGGPQQITPWLIKQAVEGSVNGSCALTITKLSNRMANGDFSTITG